MSRGCKHTSCVRGSMAVLSTEICQVLLWVLLTGAIRCKHRSFLHWCTSSDPKTNHFSDSAGLWHVDISPMGIFKIPMERKPARPETLSLMQCGASKQFLFGWGQHVAWCFMQSLLLQSHRAEDSMWLVNYNKCPNFLFPISILVGGS